MDAAKQMQVFGDLALIFGAIAVIGLGLAVFFFFYFDIPEVYALMTGKAKKKTVERVAKTNSRTGRLRVLSESLNETAPAAHIIQAPVRAGAETEPVNKVSGYSGGGENSMETTILGETPNTSVLNAGVPEAPETMVLGKTAPEAPAQIPVEYPIQFDVVESTIVIHTDEII